MTFGKAFGGGIMPITGIICKPSMWVQQLIDNPWLLGSPTFGGNPVCCSAAIATIKYMIDNDIPGQCASKGKILKAGLESLKAKYPEIIDDVRGVGLMLAVEFVTVLAVLTASAYNSIVLVVHSVILLKNSNIYLKRKI